MRSDLSETGSKWAEADYYYFKIFLSSFSLKFILPSIYKNWKTSGYFLGFGYFYNIILVYNGYNGREPWRLISTDLKHDYVPFSLSITVSALKCAVFYLFGIFLLNEKFWVKFIDSKNKLETQLQAAITGPSTISPLVRPTEYSAQGKAKKDFRSASGEISTRNPLNY